MLYLPALEACNNVAVSRLHDEITLESPPKAALLHHTPPDIPLDLTAPSVRGCYTV